jgi:hypothetical protein
MRQVLASWTNTRGETVVEHPTGLVVLPRGMTPAQWAAAGPPPTPAQQYLTPDGRLFAVQSEGPTRRAFITPGTRDHPGEVIEVESRRATAANRSSGPRFIPPQAYYALSADAVRELEAQAAALRGERDAAATWVAKQRVEAQLDEVERKLRAARLAPLDERRRKERATA